MSETPKSLPWELPTAEEAALTIRRALDQHLHSDHPAHGALAALEGTLATARRERDEARDRIYDMCSVLSSGCKDSEARSPVEWAEHMLTERDALRADVERLRGALEHLIERDEWQRGMVRKWCKDLGHMEPEAAIDLRLQQGCDAMTQCDDLRAEVERLRAALGCYIGTGPDHLYAGHCPDAEMWDSRDPDCEACALLIAALQEPTP